ncbi:MAG: long-chain fatty acid--CoA ligase, partial [Comamonadaceae bacterium]
MRPPPTTAEIVEAIALREPLRPALWEDTSRLTYGQFHGMLAQCALLLLRLGVRSGERVAVAGPGIGVQMVLLLAAEGLGAMTASFAPEGDVDAQAIFRHADWVFAGAPQAVPPGVRFHLIDHRFVRALAEPLGHVRPAWSALPMDQPQRLSRTSGSSGPSQLMVLDRAAQEFWLELGRMTGGPGAQLRLLMLGPLLANVAFTRSSACLRRGGLLMIGTGRDIAQLAPTGIWGLPVQLERLMGELPPGYVSPQPVEVASVGGLLSARLRAQVHAAFGGRLMNRYGSNEVGTICDDLDAQGQGVISPGVDVRIEDAEGNELPAGAEGIIAVRTPALARGYLDRPEDTARAFRDGWFVSGDVGAIVGWRLLRLAGRHDDLVNLGGLKMPARQIEDDIRQGAAAVADCAVQAVNLEGGHITLGIALVLKAGAST